MKALILAAGLGTRLRPLTNRTPKCMLPIAGKPCLERLVEYLAGYGIYDVAVNLHWLYPQVLKHFGNSLLYFYEPNLLGAEETERRMIPWLGKYYFVLNGDTLTDLNLNEMMQFTLDRESTVESWDKVYTGIKFVQSGAPVIKHNFKCYWQDIGTLDGLKKARKHYES